LSIKVWPQYSKWYTTRSLQSCCSHAIPLQSSCCTLSFLYSASAVI